MSRESSAHELTDSTVLLQLRRSTPALNMLRVAAVASLVTGAAAQITILGRSARNQTVIDALWNRPLNVSLLQWLVCSGGGDRIVGACHF